LEPGAFCLRRVPFSFAPLPVLRAGPVAESPRRQRLSALISSRFTTPRIAGPKKFSPKGRPMVKSSGDVISLRFPLQFCRKDADAM
jgi:hypothetical protein